MPGWSVTGSDGFGPNTELRPPSGADELNVEAGHHGRTRYVQHLTPAIGQSRAEKLADGYFAGVGRQRFLQEDHRRPSANGRQRTSPDTLVGIRRLFERCVYHHIDGGAHGFSLGR